MGDWYQRDARDVLAEMAVDVATGLSEAEVATRRAHHGANELAIGKAKGPWRIVGRQLGSLMVVILVVAAAISIAMGDPYDAAAIGVIVALNTLLGFSQEHRAERAMAALQRLAVPQVRVRRAGVVHEIPAPELVPGDIVLLEVGNQVPADGRLVESVGLQIQESALTGESESVEKDAGFTAGTDLPLGDRRNMVYLGTVVTRGRGQAVVTATGSRTELGRVAAMMRSVGHEPTPLQRRLDGLGRVLALIALAIVVGIVGLGLWRGEDTRLMLMTAISLAVAAVPEGLPAVVTVTLALGAQRLLKRHALIRGLAAVETLGSVTVICSDKTGTLTENRMAVAILDVAGHRFDLRGWLQHAHPTLDSGAELTSVVTGAPAVGVLAAGAALCSDALLVANAEKEGSYQALGEPTESALVVAAAQLGLRKPDLERVLPRVAEYPFDSQRKRMTTVHALPAPGAAASPPLAAVLRVVGHPAAAESYIAFVKGAVDSLLEVSSGVLVDGDVERLDIARRATIAGANDALARAGMRVLGVALRWLDAPFAPDAALVERELTFAGLLGMIDPPRLEAKAAVQTCLGAGIRPVMITGDHPLTARYIAGALGIARGGQVLTGAELDAYSPPELSAAVEKVEVFARVSPEHKLKIVQALQERGHVVAMTGDGVNDAPALRQADIGISMGITGTDVSKEAADMVLLDDNFATIVAAVAEGRVIYDNIRKFISFMLATNAGELWVMVLAPLAGMPLALLPLQILWVNLVTDGPPALALTAEPAEPDTMRRPPYPAGESILGRGLGWRVLWMGLLMGLLSLGPAYWYWVSGREEWRTLLFTTLVLAQMANVLAIRSERRSLFRIGLLSNRPLLGAVLLTVVLQLAVVYVPFLQPVFATTVLSPLDLLLSVAASLSVLWVAEAEKWLLRRRG